MRRLGATSICILFIAVVFLAPVVSSTDPSVQMTSVSALDPSAIPKYVNQLAGPPPVYVPIIVKDSNGNVVSHEYTVGVGSFIQQVLPAPLPKTNVWSYGGPAKDSVTGKYLGVVYNSPAPSFEAVRNIPINVKWVNGLTASHMFAVDPTLHWANPTGIPHHDLMAPFPSFPPGFDGTMTAENPMGYDAQSPVPLVPHLHGGEVQSTSDGHPEAWYTWNGIQGPMYTTEQMTDANAAVYHYPNAQPAATLWYHDHALGVTRINVMSGLAGFYLLRDPSDPIAPLTPKGKYDMPLVIQDRSFNSDGSFCYPSEGVNPDIHPYWVPQSFGNTAMVNGLVWPNMNVDKGQYMFRLLDGSNARSYTLSFTVVSTGAKLPMKQIASDGGYLRSATQLTQLAIAPGERATVLVDFSGLKAGTKVILTNSDSSCGGGGGGCGGGGRGGGGMGGGGMGMMMGPPIPEIMQFTVTRNSGPTPAKLPSILNQDLVVFPSLSSPVKIRILTLTEVMGPNGPEAILLDGQKWMSEVSEVPELGSTEVWIIVNPTMMAHPIHLHLVQFQVVSRQHFSHMGYYSAWTSVNGMPPLDHPTIEVPIGPYLMGSPSPAPANEMGWKDTVRCNMHQVTTIIVRFSPIDGGMEYPFDATEGPGYVWHCHILDHEDNEMMRPYMFDGMTDPMPM